MIVDAHTHLGDKEGWKVEDLIASMDETGIDMSLVISEKRYAPIKKILEQVEKYPKRLKAIGDINFETLDIDQINYILKLLEEDKIIGVKFYLGYENYYPSNEKLFAIYEYCQANNKPVVFHTGALETGDRGLLKYSHPLNIDEVAHHFPKLKIVMAHMGNPWLLDCAAVMSKNENVYADMSGYFEENEPIEYEEVAAFIQRLKAAWLFLGSYEKFIFGTDYPLYSQKEYLEAVLALDLNPKEKELVLWKNAAKIFNLDLT